jgi:pyruvate kinase
MTRFRPKPKILGVTNSLHVVRKMSLYWGITPFYVSTKGDSDMKLLEETVLTTLKSNGGLVNGDKIVVTQGDGKFFQQGTTNSIRVDIIKDVPRAISTGSHDSVQEAVFSKGKILHDTTICASCQACVAVCPHGIWAVSSDAHKETRIDHSKVEACTVDMECVRVCPTGAIEIIPTPQ